MSEQFTWKVVDKHLGALSFIVMLLAVSCVWILRYVKGNPVLFGEDIYNALVLFSSVTKIFSETGIRVAILAVSVALTGFGISCFWHTVNYYIESAWMKRAIMGLVSLTPGFIFASASFSRTLIVFVFCSFIWYCLTKLDEFQKADVLLEPKSLTASQNELARKSSRRQGIIYYVLLVVFSILLGILSPFAMLFVLGARYVYLDQNTSKFLLLIPSLLGSVGAYFLAFPLWNGTITIPNIVSDFGSTQGVGVMVILLAILSILFWEKQWSTRSLLITIPLAVVLVFDRSLLLVFYVMIIVLAARTWEELFFTGWALPLVRKMSILVVTLSIVFSMLVFLERASTFSPTAEEHAALREVAVYTPLSVTVFSDPTQAAYIRYYALRRPVVASEKDREYYEQTVNSAYMKEVVPLLEERGVNILYFSTDMIEYLPRDQRIRFLLTNERFKMIYLGNTTQVWMFTNGK